MENAFKTVNPMSKFAMHGIHYYQIGNFSYVGTVFFLFAEWEMLASKFLFKIFKDFLAVF